MKSEGRTVADRALRVMLAGGGTGGHLFPGVAVAREFARRHPEAHLLFVGTGRRIEQHVLAREGFSLERIRAAGIVGRSMGQRLRGLAIVPVALADAARLVERYRPRLVIGLGGYSSGPVVLWAALRRVPTLLLEQNSIPGVTNRLLSRVVRAAAVSYEATLPYFGTRGFVSGNPVRPVFFDVPPAPPAPQRVRLLVLGGSQGAHAINIGMIEAAPQLATSARRIDVTHQTGEADRQRVREAYRAVGIDSRVEAFFDHVDQEMAAADLIVCRAGATTLAEVAAAGRASILIPFPHATHDHQRRNAELVAAASAADVIDPATVSGDRLARAIMVLAMDDARRAALAAASRQLARPNAVGVVVDRMEQLMGIGQAADAGAHGGRA